MLDLVLFFLSQILAHFLLSASTYRFPWEHLVLSSTFTSITFWALTLPPALPDTFRVIKSPHCLLWKKNQKVWVLVSVSFFFSVFLFSESIWKCAWLKIKVSFWWIPQLWTFLRFSWTECWTLPRPWFFQERLDHRVMEIPPYLILYDCVVWCQK